jgi:hypothetical protein
MIMLGGKRYYLGAYSDPAVHELGDVLALLDNWGPC